MPTETVTNHYRVQSWYIPVHTSWAPQKWTLKQSSLRPSPPSGGRGVPKDVRGISRGDRITWCWDDGAGTPRKVVAIKLKQPVTVTQEYQNVYF